MAQPTPTADVEQIMHDYFDLRRGDLSKQDVLAESFTFYGPGLPEEGVQGRDAFLAFQDEMNTAFANPDMSVDELLVGDDLAMWKWTVRGMHEGEFQDVPPTGENVTFEGMSMTVISDGRVQENHVFMDPQSIVESVEE